MSPFNRLYYCIALFAYLWVEVGSQSCGLKDGLYTYDLSPLTLHGGKNYEADSPNGVGFYFINICGPVTQGSCSPEQSVCQVLDSPNGCGSSDKVDFAPLDDGKLGVKITYGGGTKADGSPRKSVIRLYCHPDAKDLSFQFVGEFPHITYNFVGNSSYACPAPQPEVKMYIVIHSHDDVGWVKTVQDYYDQSVNKIISGVVESLLKNESRKYIQVEQAFFTKWWNDPETTESERNATRHLVNNGQLSFAIGGWVMPDEATTSYNSLIDQLTEGHQFLKRTFNAVPNVGWQIDPFGASSVLAEIYKRSGFKGHVIQRINYSTRNQWQYEKKLQFKWQLSDKTDDDILTHILDTNYCFPFHTGPEPTDWFVFPATVSDAKIAEKAKVLVDIARAKALYTKTPNVLIPMGCDFSYSGIEQKFGTAKHQYEAMDRIIEYIRANAKILNVTLVQYSDVSDYFDALHKAEKDGVAFPSYKGDFFPYNDRDSAWWTGYYTSYPEFKGSVRQSEATLRASDTLYAFSNLASSTNKAMTTNATFASYVDDLIQAVSVVQHHDGITGTETKHVLNDYSTLLNSALRDNYNVIPSILNTLSASANNLNLDFGEDLVINENNTVTPVVVYNSLGWTRHDYVKLVVPSLVNFTYKVTDGDSTLKSQVFRERAHNRHTLFFKAELPPLGFKTYFIKKVSTTEPDTSSSEIDDSDLAKSDDEYSDSESQTPNPSDAPDLSSSSDSTPTEAPTSTPSPTPTPSSSPTPSPTPTPTPAPTPSPTPTPAPTPAPATPSSTSRKRSEETPETSGDQRIDKIANNNLAVHFSENTIAKVTSTSKNITFQQQFLLYKSTNEPNQQRSGKYIFLPEKHDPIYPVSNTSKINVTHISGDFVTELYQEYKCDDASKSFVRQHVRVFHDDDKFLGNFLELAQHLGPLPRVGAGRELITRFTSPIFSNKSYTDNNGLRFLERIYQDDLLFPIPGNYFPAVYGSYVKDKDTMIGFAYDRSHGFSSSFQNVDIMMHRRTLQDDGRGVSEPLDDGSEIDPVIRVVFGSPEDTLELLYRHIYLLNFPPVVTVGEKNVESIKEWKSNHVSTGSILNGNEMPPNVHILTLKAMPEKNQYLFRLVHLFEKGEHSTLSKPAQILVHDIFHSSLCVVNLTETSLTGNQEITSKFDLSVKTATITLGPKDIKTFILKLAHAEATECPQLCEHGFTFNGTECVVAPVVPDTKCGEYESCGTNAKCSAENSVCECEDGYAGDPYTYCEQTGTMTWAYAIHVAPLAVHAYVLLILTFGVRSQLKKLARPSARTKSKRKVYKGRLGRVKQFLHANNQIMEWLFFPPDLQRHED